MNHIAITCLEEQIKADHWFQAWQKEEKQWFYCGLLHPQIICPALVKFHVHVVLALYLFTSQCIAFIYIIMANSIWMSEQS